MKERNNLKRKRMSLAIGLSMAILVAYLGVDLALAGVAPKSPVSKGDPIQTNNKHNKGLKAPHSARKAAAKRLRQSHQKEHQQNLQRWANSHHGYTGLGVAGNSLGNTSISAVLGGAK